MPATKTRRVCIHQEPYDICIMRPGKYRNPFKIGRDGDRPTVVAKFKKYFDERIKKDKQFLIDVMKLKDKRLGCCCRIDEACHGDIYVDFLNELLWREL